MNNNKKNIIIVGDNFADPSSACGICNLSMAAEFLRRGHTIWTLSISKTPFNVELISDRFHYVHIRESRFTSYARSRNTNRSIWKRISWLFRYYIRLPFAFITYPVGSQALVSRLYNSIDDIVKENNVDIILSTFSPYESIAAGIRAKKKYSNIRFVSYHLDPLLIRKNNNLLIDNYKLFRGKKALKKEMKYVDCLLAQPSTKEFYYSSSINYVYFPLYKETLSTEKPSFDFPADSINITYIGTLDMINRNPSYVFEIFSRIREILVKKAQKICVHIWGKISDDTLMSKIEDWPFVVYHGVISPKYVDYLMCKSDFVLNVSNGLSYTAIPSKIFQLFSSKRPIVNFVRHPKDFSRGLFELYPCVLNLEEFNKKDSDVSKLASFIENNRNEEVCVDKSIFRLSDPDYICNLIENI